MKKIIHVVQWVIASNAKHNANECPIMVRLEDDDFQVGHSVEIQGPSRIVYDRDARQAGGVRCWIETDASVVVKADGKPDFVME